MAFDRVKAAGWAALETLTSTQMNALDRDVSLAADSRFLPDYFGVINVMPIISSDVRMGVYSATHGSWVYIGGPDGTPVSFTSVDNYRFASGGAVANTGTWGVRDMAVNPSGVVVAVGQTTASNSKVRRSTDGGATWTAQTAGAADSNGLTSVIWHSSSSLFVAAGMAGLITTSPDGITWTTRAAPGGWGALNIGRLATDGTTIVGTQQDTGVADTDYLRTTTPTDWSTSHQTFSTSTRAQGVTWSSVAGWVIPGIPSKKSSDATTWTDTGNLPAVGTGPIAIYRHLIVLGANSAYFTVDQGATYERFYDGTAVGLPRWAFGRGQFVGFDSALGLNSRGGMRMALT